MCLGMFAIIAFCDLWFIYVSVIDFGYSVVLLNDNLENIHMPTLSMLFADRSTC